MLQKIQNNKKAIYWLVSPLVILGIFMLFAPANAGSVIAQGIMNILGWLLLPVIHFLGNILLIMIEILIGVFQYSQFINTPAVQLGWVIMRDIANIGIVVALIIISFATVFRIQRYAASQLLIKLIIAAFAVNFSLVITGLIIDLGQVAMMFFVNQFKTLAAGNLTVGFGVEDMLKVAASVGDNPAFEAGDYFAVLGAMLLAIVLLLAAISVVMVFVIVLLQRIIYLWILAIFSPISWVAPLIPGGDSWGGRWWSHFGRQVFIGPVLAFGFWLSMSILSGLSAQQSLIRITVENTAPNEVANSNVARFVSEVSTPQAIFDFMVTIALMLGTLWMAKEAGGAAASFSSSTLNRFKNAPGASLRLARRGAAATGRAAINTKTGQRAVGMAEGLTQRTLGVVKMDKASRQARKDEAQNARAGTQERFGGAAFAGAIRANEEKAAAAKQKELQESGAISSPGQAKQVLQSSFKDGDRIQALAVMKQLAKDKALTPAEVKQYTDKFGGGLQNLNNARQRTAAEHVEALWATQGAAGDTLAGYKSSVKRNDAGNLVTYDREARMDKVRSDFATMGVDGMKLLSNPKILTGAYDPDTGKVSNELELQALLGSLEIDQDTGEISETAKKNIGRLNPSQRKFLRDYIAGVAAKKEDHGLKETDANYKGLMQATAYMSDGISYSTTGEVTSTARPDSIKTSANYSGLTDDEIEKKGAKIDAKKATQRRDTLVLGLEGRSSGEQFSRQDTVVATELQGGVDQTVLNSNIRKVDEARSEADEIANKLTLLKSTREAMIGINGVFNQLLARAKALDKDPKQRTGQIGIKANGVEGELSFEEILRQSQIGKIKESMGTVMKNPRTGKKERTGFMATVSNPNVDVKTAKKQLQALLDQTHLQITAQQNIIPQRSESQVAPEKLREKQVQTRTASVSGLSQANEYLGGLSTVATGKERMKTLKQVRNKIKTVMHQSQKHNDDTKFNDELEDMLKNVKLIISDQKAGRVASAKIKMLNEELARLGKRYQTKV